LQAGGGETTATGKNLPCGGNGQTTPAITRASSSRRMQIISENPEAAKAGTEQQPHTISLRHSRICAKRRQSCTIALDWIASEIAQS
jgi:hypothetical protein